jgi:hypothetical protein
MPMEWMLNSMVYYTLRTVRFFNFSPQGCFSACHKLKCLGCFTVCFELSYGLQKNWPKLYITFVSQFHRTFFFFSPPPYKGQWTQTATLY